MLPASSDTSAKLTTMGRRSVKEERTEQILTAFEQCVAAHGLEGVTLERVAEVAKVGRPDIRHHVGNRDDLVKAALERIALRHKEAYAQVAQALPDNERVEALLQYLFVGPFSPGTVDAEDSVLDALFAARHREPRVAKLLVETYEELESIIAAELRKEHPNATRNDCSRVAYGLMALAFGHSTFSGLGNGARRGPSTLAQARALVQTL